MAVEGVPECCSGARAQWETRRRWYLVRGRASGACHASATSSPRHGRAQSERAPIACSPRPRTAQIGRVRVEIWLLKACRNVARRGSSPKGTRRRWYLVRGRASGACHSTAASSLRHGRAQSERAPIACRSFSYTPSRFPMYPTLHSGPTRMRSITFALRLWPTEERRSSGPVVHACLLRYLHGL